MDKPAEPRYPLRFVVARTGLSADLLRAWERRYDAVRPQRTQGGQRLYSDADIERLTLMQRLTTEGHSIGEIARLTGPALAALLEAPAMPATADDAVDGIVQQAIAATERLDAGGVEASLRRAALAFGSTTLVDRAIPRFLRVVGKRWHSGSLGVAQEHLASAAVRRAIGWATEAFVANGAAAGVPVVVVGTPPGELHELGAMLAAAAAMEEGWRVVYVGASVPGPELVNTVLRTAARAVALSVVYPQGRAERQELLAAVKAMSKHCVVLVGGDAAQQARSALRTAGAQFLPDLSTFRRTLRALRQSDSLDALP